MLRSLIVLVMVLCSSVHGSRPFPSEALDGLTLNNVTGIFETLFNCLNSFCDPLDFWKLRLTEDLLRNYSDILHRWITDCEYIPSKVLTFLHLEPGNPLYTIANEYTKFVLGEDAKLLLRSMMALVEEVDILRNDAKFNQYHPYHRTHLMCRDIKVSMIKVYLFARLKDKESPIPGNENLVDSMVRAIGASYDTCAGIVTTEYANLGWTGDGGKGAMNDLITQQVIPFLDIVQDEIKDRFENWFYPAQTTVIDATTLVRCYDIENYTTAFILYYNVKRGVAEGIVNAALALIEEEYLTAFKTLQKAGIIVGKTLSDAANDEQVEHELEALEVAEEQARAEEFKEKENFNEYMNEQMTKFYSRWRRAPRDHPFLLGESANSMLRKRHGPQFTGDMVIELVQYFKDGKICISLEEILNITTPARVLFNPIIASVADVYATVLADLKAAMPDIVPSIDFFEPLLEPNYTFPRENEVLEMIEPLRVNPTFQSLDEDWSMSKTGQLCEKGIFYGICFNPANQAKSDPEKAWTKFLEACVDSY